MPDTFAITVFFIIVCTVIGAFVKGRAKDLCLRDFSGYPVTLERNDGKIVWGKLRVEHSCIELVYDEPYMDENDGHVEMSYILYKSEYGQLKSLVRYVDGLDEELAGARKEVLERARRPHWFSRFARKTRNFFGTIRDSLLEIVNLFVGRIKAASPVSGALKGQDKYVSRIQQQAESALHASYEPILERYVGMKVVLVVMSGDKKNEYAGILKDYTTEFIEIMDVEYRGAGGKDARLADLVVPRTVGTIRHSGE